MMLLSNPNVSVLATFQVMIGLLGCASQLQSVNANYLKDECDNKPSLLRTLGTVMR
jgi:hypothetical protein